MDFNSSLSDKARAESRLVNVRHGKLPAPSREWKTECYISISIGGGNRVGKSRHIKAFIDAVFETS